MSDPQEPVGEPVEEPTPVGDMVSQAHEGLADAEAAGRDAVDATPASSADDAASNGTADGASAADTAQPAEHAQYAEHGEYAVPESAGYDGPAERYNGVAGESETSAGEPAFTTPGLNDAYAADQQNAYAAEHENVSATDREAPATEPVQDDYAAATAAGAAGAAATSTPAGSPTLNQGQPIFVQAPEEPRPRGNRAAAGGIGVIAAICFAALYLAADLVIAIVQGKVGGAAAGTWLIDQLGTWSLWVPTAVFFLAFWLLGAIVNRGRWGVWVIFGLLVGLAAYGGHILGQLFEAPFWNVTVDEGVKIAHDQLFAPLAIAAFVIGRELTIWFSAWVAARGRRMTELNLEAQREYERTIEAGPQLAR